MFKELLAGADVLDLPLIAMFFFITVFAVVVWRTLSRRRTPQYEHMSRLPLDDHDARALETQE